MVPSSRSAKPATNAENQLIALMLSRKQVSLPQSHSPSEVSIRNIETGDSPV